MSRPTPPDATELPPDLDAKGYRLLYWDEGTRYAVRDPQRPWAGAIIQTTAKTYAAVSARHGCTDRHETVNAVIAAARAQSRGRS